MTAVGHLGLIKTCCRRSQPPLRHDPRVVELGEVLCRDGANAPCRYREMDHAISDVGLPANKGFERSLITSSGMGDGGASGGFWSRFQPFAAEAPRSTGQEGFEHSPITSTLEVQVKGLFARVAGRRTGPAVTVWSQEMHYLSLAR